MRDRSPGIGPRPALLAAAALIVLVAMSQLHAQTDPDEVRAIWILRTTLSSPSSIETMVDAAKAAAFNALFVEVSGRFDSSGTRGLSGSLASPSFDAMAEVTERAHAAGLRVHAWIDVTGISSAVELPLSRDHVVYRHPDWLMVPQSLAADLIRIDPKSPEYLGRLARYVRAQSGDLDGLYLSPVTPGAVEYMAGAVRELVARYAVDGIHLDHARYPRADFDYGRDALAAFRRCVVDSLLAADQAKYDRQLVAEPLMWARIGASWLSPTDIVASVRAARRLGAGGVIIFSYDSLTGPSRGPEYLAQLGHSAFLQ